MPVGNALRMCFPPLLFISLIYLYFSQWAQPLAEQVEPRLFLFISFQLIWDSLSVFCDWLLESLIRLRWRRTDLPPLPSAPLSVSVYNAALSKSLLLRV